MGLQLRYLCQRMLRSAGRTLFGANFWRSSERAANIEMYEPDGELCFNQGAGIGIFGGYSRGLPQKSLFVVARSKYGAKNFKYPIFPERDFDKYKSFVLRNSGEILNERILEMLL